MKELLDYIQDPNNDRYNFNLGLIYFNNKQYSPASSFYLRCSEITKNNELRYECLIKLYLCFSALGDREHTCEGLLKLAISLYPKKPEAYFFLSQYYEKKSDWLNIYLYANIALENCSSISKFISDIDFPGMYVFLFQKALSSWRIGKPQEARQLYKEILNSCIDELNDTYKILLENNLSSLGCGPENIAIRRYNKSLKDKLKYKFSGIEEISDNCSQVYQDIFILTCLNGKRNGTYLEIGASDPHKNSNTSLLETKFDWTGVGIEYNIDFVSKYKGQRKNPILCTDALVIDYKKLLNKYFPNQNNLDYLQLDIEPPKNTYEALLSIPFNEYKFAVITYEHDFYVDITRSYREKSREYLSKLGYLLVVPNISPNEDSPFEDWWVHPELISAEIIKKIKCPSLTETNPVESYFLVNN